LAPWPKDVKTTHPAARTSKSSTSRFTRIAILSAGWALLAFLCLRISNAPPAVGEVTYNPFEILGLGSSSTDKQIKKHYKKLSLQL